MKQLSFWLYFVFCLTSEVAIAQQPDLDPPFSGASASGKINSPYGPRNPCTKAPYTNCEGSKSIVHHGIDYNLLTGSDDKGILLPVFIEGQIDLILIKDPQSTKDSGGHSLGIKSNGRYFHFLHLFNPPPSIGGEFVEKNGRDVGGKHLFQVILTNKLVAKKNGKVMKDLKQNRISCPLIIFLSKPEYTIKHAYTTHNCNGATFEYAAKIPGISGRTNNQKFIATSNVNKEAFEWLVPIGESGIAKGIAHTHVQMGRGGKAGNPLLHIKHSETPAYEIELVNKTLARGLDKKLLVKISYSPTLDLNFINFKLPAEFGDIDVTPWDFGGKNGRQRPQLIKGINYTISNLQGCEDKKLLPDKQSICSFPWNVRNVDKDPTVQKTLYFHQPIDLSNAAEGTYKVSITANSVNHDYQPVEETVTVVPQIWEIKVTDQSSSVDCADAPATQNITFTSTKVPTDYQIVLYGKTFIVKVPGTTPFSIKYPEDSGTTTETGSLQTLIANKGDLLSDYTLTGSSNFSYAQTDPPFSCSGTTTYVGKRIQ